MAVPSGKRLGMPEHRRCNDRIVIRIRGNNRIRRSGGDIDNFSALAKVTHESVELVVGQAMHSSHPAIAQHPGKFREHELRHDQGVRRLEQEQ